MLQCAWFVKILLALTQPSTILKDPEDKKNGFDYESLLLVDVKRLFMKILLRGEDVADTQTDRHTHTRAQEIKKK